ncbi:alkane 1-monooxygenase [Primorskyibacter sp. S87]|uniref:alkane 1-monooxygenase n=1 Tax=Primorskyibacter sp. S87 TaxID=3415126 RepID=UPI003C7A88F3
MIWFPLASLLPALLVIAGALFGGIWPWLALGSMTAWVYSLDRVRAPGLRRFSENGADRLELVLGLVHFLVLGLTVLAIARGNLTTSQSVALFFASGLFLGQVSNSNAHELIHRSGRAERALGVAVYSSLLFGHHASAHRRVHHVHVATDRDPNSARKGEGFYHFWPRAWLGSFRAGLKAETEARQRRSRKGGLHPYVIYVGGGLLTLVLAFAFGGLAGALVLLALTAHAQMQLLLADYIQHYGLRRLLRDGKPEPVGPQHSWNAPQWYSSAMMLNAPRHSDHHMHPARRFPDLRLDKQDMPIWPRSMPVMAAIAMVPPVWRQIMDRRTERWLPNNDAVQTEPATGGSTPSDLTEFEHDAI